MCLIHACQTMKSISYYLLSVNHLTNELQEEYKIGVMDVKNLVEKGFFHLFGELYLDGINSLRTGPPDRSECVLSMGRIAGQHLCPEQGSFQIKLCTN